ncbi:MAG: hypothetical protein GEU97_20150 [Actinophytocola sp.]|nr:hypothetical protein [Actinophytocola sp.]
MPLDPLQELIARRALELPQARTLALAGGGAMIAHGFVDRATKDVDLSTEVDDAEAVEVAQALRDALQVAGIDVRDAEREPRDHRFVAVDPASGEECTVEVFPDGGRLHGRVSLDIGAVLHPADLAADKVLALWGRARPRDYFDVAALLDRYSPGELLEFAAAKDAGFTPATFVDALRAIRRLAPEDWDEDGVEPNDVGRLQAIFDDWRTRLVDTP